MAIVKNVKELETLLNNTCESINKINELSTKFNIDDDTFRKLLDTNPLTGVAFVRSNFLEIYNNELNKQPKTN